MWKTWIRAKIGPYNSMIVKDTIYSMKTEMQMKMLISTEDLNIPDVEEEVTMTSGQRTTMVFYSYNKPENIELPEECVCQAKIILSRWCKSNQRKG